jgi:hypothetical protein
MQRQQDLSECEKLVDELQKSLHNLVSLLLMQRRKTVVLISDSVLLLSDAIFNNLQPISVGA